MEFQKPSDSEFTVYSKSGCNYCLKVKTLLRDSNQLFNIIDCDDYIIEDKTKFLLFIETLSKREIKQFPIIFHKGNIIGGFNETFQYIRKLLLSFEDI